MDDFHLQNSNIIKYSLYPIHLIYFGWGGKVWKDISTKLWSYNIRSL